MLFMQVRHDIGSNDMFEDLTTDASKRYRAIVFSFGFWAFLVHRSDKCIFFHSVGTTPSER